MKVVGRYELLDPIGYGGMAVVYLARQIDLDRRIALKELRLQSPDEPTLAERFLREARMAGSMSHPNIVTVHEYFKHEGTAYIAMEYLQRGSLRPWVGHLTLAQIAGVLEGLLAALDHAERLHIVHRDIKPENLLVTDQGQIKVADYGIAKARTVNGDALLTAAGTTVGTPTYMAPEQALGHELGPGADLYAVGVLAYELVVGRGPFQDTDTPLAVILRHVNETIPSAHTVDPAIDRALSDWIDRLLVKDPAQRTQSAQAAWEELEEVVLRLLGSRWRREARLMSAAEQPVAPPLTPATFASTGEAPITVASAAERKGSAASAAAVPAAAAPARVRSRRHVVLLSAGAVGLIAVAVGVVLAGGEAGGGASDAAHPLRTADLALTLPASWNRRELPESLGLDPAEAVAAAPGPSSYVVVGLVGGRADPTLLAPKLRSALTPHVTPARVTLAALPAYRYDGLQPHGGRERLRVYAVLTDAGVATVACGTFPTAPGTAAADCSRIARTLKLRSAKALPIGPTKGFAAILKDTFASLDARVRALNPRLDRAGTAEAQAATLRQISRAYGTAATSLKRIGDRRGDGATRLNVVDTGLAVTLATALDGLALAYRQLGRVVRDGTAVARAEGERGVRRARAKLADALGSLRRAGYPAAPRVTARSQADPPAPSLPSVPGPATTPPPPVSPPAAPPAQPSPPASVEKGGGGGG